MTVRTNSALNPGLESGVVTGWNTNSVGAYPTTLDATSVMTGVYSLRADRAVTTPSTAAASIQLTTAGVTSAGFPCTAGTPVTAGIDVKSDQANRRVQMSFQWLDAGNVLLSSTTATNAVSDTGAAGTVVRAVQTQIPPAGAVTCRVVITVATLGGNAVTGEKTWFDNLLVESAASSDGSYFDGDGLDTPSVLYSWTGAVRASSSTRNETIPAPLTLGWVDSQGAVRFTVLNVPNDGLTTVKRVNPGGTLTAIRGYPDGAWHGTSGLGYDYEAPMSVWVRYAICDRDAKNLTASMVTAVIFTETPGRTNGEAWLRDVLQPVLSQPVSVVSTGDEVYVARQTVLEVAGKRTPYVVWDSRQSRQGTVVLAVRNTVVSGVWNDSTKRAKLEALFSTGRPLLLSMCANKGFRNAYLAIDSVTFTRRGADVSWLVSLDYFEVDNPTGLGVQIVPEVTYAIAQQLPPSATYQSWAGTGVGDGILYYDVATRLSLP
jgi:hypothetical protein